MEKLKVYRTAVSPYQGEDFREKEKALLSKLGIVYLDSAEGADILITNTHTNIDEYDLSKVKLIIHPNSGYDNFKAETITKVKCPIIIGHEIRANAVATYTLAAFYSHFVQLPLHNVWDRERLWDRTDINKLKVQLIGKGHIGSRIEESLGSVVDQVFCFDPFLGHNDLKLGEADVVIFACGLNHTSYHFLNLENIHLLKQNVLIINGARGKLIEQEALFEFLKANPNAKAFLDVFENEPIDIGQFGIENLHPTSHIAGVTSGLNRAIMDFSHKVLSDFLTKNEQEMRESYRNEILQNKVVDGHLI